jgi:hypothetical protein
MNPVKILWGFHWKEYLHLFKAQPHAPLMALQFLLLPFGDLWESKKVMTILP